MARKAAVTLDASTRFAVLHGPEEMVRRLRFEELRDALLAEHGDADTFHFDGKTAELSEVFDELRGYSLMATYKLVVVENADEFVKKHREPLERYAAAPVDHATLVLRAEKWNKGNLDKAIAKVGAVVKCDAPKPGEAVTWLTTRAAEVHKVRVARDAAALLVDRIGVHLMALDSEVGKLAAMAGEGGEITRELVQRAVGKSSDEKAWEVQAAVLEGMAKRSPGRMLEVVHELIEVGGQPDVLVLYFVTDLMRKLSVAAAMRRGGAADAEINKALRLWGPAAATFHRVARQVNEAAAADLLQQALTLDARSKSGFGSASRNLERFCVGLARVG